MIWEMVCLECGNKVYEDKFVEGCVRVEYMLEKRLLCDGKNMVKSVMMAVGKETSHEIENWREKNACRFACRFK